jgi:ElaB/YqjD/DUF883 family membrane-anchored ribosome-binding protein
MLENEIGTMRDAANHARNATGKAADDLGQQASGMAKEAADALQDRYAKVADRLQDGLHRTTDGVQGLYSELDQLLQDRPYVALTAAVGVGLLLGMLLIGRRPIVVRKA